MADAPQNLKLLLALLPKLPLIVRVAVMHVLRLSEPARYLDLRSELVVAVLRSFLEPSRPRSVTSVQRLTLRDAGVKGRMWVSTYTSPPPPETSVRDALVDVIHSMRDEQSLEVKVRVPELSGVEAEWTGYRAAAAAQEPLPVLSEKGKFEEMMKETTQPTTILYLHGGAYYLCDPATHRSTTKKLAKLTGGRCYSVRYRLAPQHPFPAALLDALISYLTLLYPPPDAYHSAVKPEHVVFAGDSAGGNLAMALLQLVLQLQRQNMTIEWYDSRRTVPVPASVACNSPWFDVTQSSPTWHGDTPAPFDYLPKVGTASKASILPCGAWPAQPPRQRFYVDDDMATHPLASLVMCDSWEGSPPLYLCTGWEILAYEDKYMAKKLAAERGIKVVFEEYEAMPHCFALLLGGMAGARRCFDGWAGFIRASVEDPASIQSSAVTVRARTLEEVPLQFERLSDVGDEQMRGRVVAMAGQQSTQDIPARL